MNKDVIRKIYDAMSKEYDMAEDFNTFSQDIQNKDVARRVYDAMYERYRMEEDFDEFYKDLSSTPIIDGVKATESGSVVVDEPQDSLVQRIGKAMQGVSSPSALTPTNIATPDAPELTQEEKDQRAAMRQRLQEDGTIDRMKESKKEARRDKLRAFGSMLGSTPQVTSFGVSTNVFDSTDEQLADVGQALDAGTEYRQNKLLQEKLDVALDMARAGENQDGLRGVENFGLGLWDSATRLSTWDFGASDIVNNLTLQQIVEKWENDPSSLTATEQKVLEGIGMATAVQELYADQVGIGYNVGQSLPESASFMMGMALNPASGLGKSLARNAVRTYGRNSIAKNLARIGGDIAETAIMTATTGAGRVAADALERINGSSTYEIGENGVIMYGGQKDQETVGNAVIKAIGANFIENYSEALGEYFDPLLGMSRKVAAGGLRKMNLNKWADALSDVQPSQMTASIRSLREKTKFGGIFGEIMEEEIGMALNTLFVGDNKWSDFTDLETQLTTVLSCAIMSGTLNGVEQVSNVAARRRMEKNAKDAEQDASYRFHRDEFAPLREAIDQASPEGMVDVLRDVYMSQEYTVGQKRALAEYAAARLQLQYYNAADAKARRQVNKTQQELLDAQEAGLNAQLPQFFNIARAAQFAEDELLDYDGDFNLVDIIRSSMNRPEEMERILGDLPLRETKLVTDYIYSRARMEGAYQGRSNRAEDYIDDFAYALEPAVVTDAEGNRTITTAIMGDRSVYVLDNNGDLAHIMYPDGSKTLVKASELTNITTSSAEEVIDRYRDMYTFEYNAETENAFEHHPKTQAPQVGLQLQSPEGEVVITAVNDNMVEIVPAVYKDGQVQPKEGSEPRTITVDDAYMWQDSYYQGLDDAAATASQPTVDNISAETTENEGTPTEQIEQSVSEKVTDGQNGYVGRTMTQEEADAFIPQMVQMAEPSVDLEFTPENWIAEFGEEGVVPTPIGAVKMGENQYFKLSQKKRTAYFGMVKPTLTNPDLILEEYDPKEEAERDTKLIFVKTFVKPDGSRTVNFESVTVKKGDLEVSISSHEIDNEQLFKKVQQDKLLHLNEKFSSSELRLTEPQQEGSDLVPSPNSISSNVKGSGNVSDVQVNGQENVVEDANIDASINKTARERVPKDDKGNPIYEQTDADTAWDAIVEETEGNVEMAQSVAEQMLANKKAALEKLQKGKAKAGANVAQIIANEKKHQEAIAKAEADVKAWERIARVNIIRQQKAELERAAAEKAEAEQRKAEEARILAEQEEQARIEREQLNGVPDMVDDTPQDARARGFRRVNGHKVDRQGAVPSLQGKEVGVKFANDMIANGRVAVIEAETLQPSHLQGQRNPAHFIDEAQPKERNDEASVASARQIASNIRPEEITTSVTAYTGAPTVNMRGEAIQGNSRSDALRVMWAEHPDQAEKYKQYLIDHAEEFGLNAEEIGAMQHPVLVNMLDVSDADAINLGQYVAQDTESGGTERIKPKNVARKMGSDIRSYANILLRSSDEEASFSELVDKNGVEVLKWMNTKGYITPTQYASAFDSKGNMTAEAKNDLRGILYQSIFQGGNTQLEEQFNAMPAKAQKAILATAYRDYDSPESERMVSEIQSSIRAYYALSHDRAFVDAKNYAEAKEAMLVWSRQYQMDDVTGESFLPSENFSNFALELAVRYKGNTQSATQNLFNELFDLIQGTKEASLFEEADNRPRTLAEAIKETLNIDYNGQNGSNALVGDDTSSQEGRQGSAGDSASGELSQNNESTTDDRGRTAGDSDTRAEEARGISEVEEPSDGYILNEEEKESIDKATISQLKNLQRTIKANLAIIDRIEQSGKMTEDLVARRKRDTAWLKSIEDNLSRKEQIKAKNKWGVKSGNHPVSLDTVKQMFAEWNENADIQALFDRVVDTFEKLGINITFEDNIGSGKTQGWFAIGENRVKLPTHMIYSNRLSNQSKASVMVHEMIHGVTQYVLYAAKLSEDSRRKQGINLSEGMITAAEQLNEIYGIIKKDKRFKGQYGIEDVHEMVSELAEPEFRALLKATTIWDRIVEAIRNILGLNVENNALDGVSKALDYIIDNYDADLYRKVSAKARRKATANVFDMAEDVLAERELQAKPVLRGESEDNLRFREKEESKDGKSLVGLHNISEDKLKKAIKMGGLANPSMAVIDIDKQDHTGYGGITLVAPSSLIDKKTGKNVGTYTADAWTPIYPNVVKQMSNEKAYNESIGSIPSELRSRVRLYFNAYLEDGNISGAMYYWFLHDTGRNPEMVQSKSEVYSEDELNAFEAISRDYSFYRLSKEDKQKVLDLYVKSIGGQEEFDKKIARRIEHMQKQLLREDLKPMLRQKVERKLQEIQERGYDYDAVSEYYDAAQRVLNTRGKLDEFATFRNAEDVVRNEGLQKDFEDWLAEKEEQFGVKEYIFTGYTNNGDRKYVPNTLANASKEMKKSGRAGATGLAGFNHYISTLAQNVGSLNQIRKKKSNLSSEEEYNAFRDKWGEVYIELAQALQPDADGWADYGFYRLEEMSTVKNPKEHVKKEYGIDLSDDFMQKYNSLVAAIKNDFPARYFETKFERPVYLNEFAAAVVPTGTSQEVVDALKQSGLEVVEYEQGNEEARTEAVRNITNEIENIRFRDGAPFFSNAERAVENIKQQKATPEQWLAMIKKDGGLKAGEDKWMGLSDWLNEQKTQGVKTLTKDEVLQFIRENQIEIEEVNYEDGVEDARYDAEEAIRENLQELFDMKVDEVRDENPEQIYMSDIYEEAFERVCAGVGYNKDDAPFVYTNATITLRWYPDVTTDELLDLSRRLGFNYSDSLNIPNAEQINSTRLDYTTEGLDNKKEIAFVIPTIESWNRNDETHFGDAGDGRAVAWVRFGETTDKDGNRVLVIDEVQSKRHDEGRAKGYSKHTKREEFRRLVDEMYDKYGANFHVKMTRDEEIEFDRLTNERIREDENNNSAVPDAPFDKNYHELVMKRMLRYAAENGFDKVAWNTGKQVAERFGVSRSVEKIQKYDENTYNVYLSNGSPYMTLEFDDDGIYRDEYDPDLDGKSMSDIFGKQLSSKLQEMKEGEMLEEEGLSIGGDDRVALYDEMIPRFMNKYTKKWGTKVGEVTLPNVEKAGRTMWSVDVTPEMRESVMQGQPMFREGMGAISDREVSYENDPIAKFQGKPRYYGKKAAAFAERERRRMENAAKEAAEMLGIKAEIITDASTLQGRKAKAKGWYDIVNKKVVVVVPNHVSMGDAVRTVLHEGIAHHGLRELFGDGFDAMLDNVYNNVAPELRARIDAIAERTGVSTSVATEEYLAGLAETTNFEEAQRRGWWQKIKSYFVDMLRKLSMPGLKLKEEITDNELRYLLWRSYKNLVEPNSYLKPLGFAEDVAKQKELKVGEYAENTMATPMAAETSEAEEWAAVTMQRIEELEAQAAQLENEIAEMEADRDADDASRYEMWEQQLEPLRKQMEDVYAELEGLYSLEAEEEDIEDYEAEREAEKQRQFYQKRIDNAYLKAVREGDWEEATDLFRQYVLSKAEDEGIVPMDYGVGYRGGAHSSIAKKVKEENPDAIAEAAYQMSIRIPKGSILVPMPSRTGNATYTVKLAEAIAKATDSEVRDVLKGKARMSVYEAKQKGIKMTPEDLGMYTTEELPKGKNIVIIDNVIDKGTTALAAVSAVKGASVVAYAYTLGDKQRVASLKLAEPVTYDDNKRIIPLSRRFDKETDDIRYRLVDDPAEIDRLESEPTRTAYRAMQVINGELYPPMSAVVDGKLREPIALGQWEQSEERPDLADGNGRFKLDKGNKKSLKAAYNPYFHSSPIPLNDQFSEAQSRDNLVTVEVEIPVSETDGTSGYKAEKAKDAVGTHEWKAGIIQSQFTGTRSVFLTRWDKPVRIVPDSEVADVIVEMFDGKDIVMPSNVVTPQLRKELEARGITFVETDNQGKLVEGEHKGEHYSKVYGKKADGLRYREDSVSLPNMNEKAEAFANIYRKSLDGDFMLPSYAEDAIENALSQIGDDIRAEHGSDTQTFFQSIGQMQYNRLMNAISNEGYGYNIPYAESWREDYADEAKDMMDEMIAYWAKEKLQDAENVEKYIPNNVLSAVKPKGNVYKMLSSDVVNVLQNVTGKSKDEIYEGYAHEGDDMLTDEDFDALENNDRTEIISEVERESAALGVPVRIARSVDELPDEDTRKRAVDGKLKGYFDPRTGEVVVYEPNTENANDAKRTILHEIVGHKGLRQLIGEQRYDKAMLQLMYMLPADVRDAVLRRAERHGWNAAIAMDEYLADQAERDVQPTWWGKVNAKIRALLRNMGFDVKLTDADVTYLLWRSRKKLQGDTAFDMATDAILKQAARKSAEAEAWNEQAFKDMEMRDFERNALPSVRHRMGADVNDYEKAVRTLGFKQAEAWQDSMRSLLVFQQALAKASGKDISDFENAYMYENRMSSANLMEMEQYRHMVYNPLLKEIHELEQMGASREDIINYLFAKSGLERNEVFARRDAKKHAEGDAAKEQKLYDKYRQKDYAGLTALTRGDAQIAALVDDHSKKKTEYERLEQNKKRGVAVSDADLKAAKKEMDDARKAMITAIEAEAQRMVDEFEAQHNTDNLWDKIRNCTHTTLNISHDAGVMSDEAYNELWNQFQYYIPLRGFAETTAEDVYLYLGGNDSPYNAPIKTAYGRTSLADDPIATIGNMAESAIVEANRNRLKQRFLYMVERHNTDLASISNVWLEYDDVNDEWHTVFAQIPDDATPSEAKRLQQEFEDRMKLLAEQNPGKYANASQQPNIPYRVVKKKNQQAHHIIVKRNGKDVVITINGNPRVAQAINGLTNPEQNNGPVQRIVNWVNRNLSANFTMRNPAFMVSNFVRDGFYTNSMVWVKENPAYARQYNKNWAICTAQIASLVKRYKRYEKGDTSALDMNNDMDRMFYEFMINGGETGYTVIKSVEDYKGLISGEMKKMEAGAMGTARRVADTIGNVVDTFGRWAEDTSRFAAYMTSRQLGRTITKSIWDAKEISVNFNKKGSGNRMMGKFEQGNRLNYVLSNMSQLGRNLYVFWNAGIQGLNNFGKAAKKSPAKFTAMAGTYFTLGVIVAAAFSGDDDEDDYYNLPEHVRRNNICFKIGKGKYATLPLPIEIRAIYGLGELAYSYLSGREGLTHGEAVTKTIQQMTQVLPIDMMADGGGAMALVPSAAKPVVEVIHNVDWTGRPIYKEKTPWNQNDPTWTLAFKSTSPELVQMSRLVNEWTNKNTADGLERPYNRGWADNRYLNNPAVWEHIMEGYLGGMATMFNQTKKTLMMPFNEDLREVRNVPIASRFIKDAGKEGRSYAARNEYYDAKNIMDSWKNEMSKAKKEVLDESLTDEQRIKAAKLRSSLEQQYTEAAERWKVLDRQRKALEEAYKNDQSEDNRQALDDVMMQMATLVEAYRD